MPNEAAKKMHLRGIYNDLLDGADVNKRDGHNLTSLIIATHKQNIEIIDILLENGADIQAKRENTGKFIISSKGKTLYKFTYDDDLLTATDDLNIIKHLIAKGYKINGKI